MKDGVEKTFWANVGTMTEFTKPDGSISRMIEIPAIGLQAQVFEIVERTQTTTQQPRQTESILDKEYPTDNINPEDIPF